MLHVVSDPIHRPTSNSAFTRYRSYNVSNAAPTRISVTANRKPDPFAPNPEQSTQLIAQARQLDTRLRTATHVDRQLTRRAAGHLTQLARRLSVLLSRTSTALPMIPVAGVGRKLNHYVLHAERVNESSAPDSVRMLTVGSNGMLRTGSTDLDGHSFVWIEYDPFDPTGGWEVDMVLQWVADALQRLETQVEAIEVRTRERTQSLGTLVAATKKPGSAPEGRAPNPFAPLPNSGVDAKQDASPLRPISVSYSSDPLLSLGEDASPVDAMEEMARADAGAIDANAPVEDAATRHRRELFKRIRKGSGTEPA